MQYKDYMNRIFTLIAIFLLCIADAYGQVRITDKFYNPTDVPPTSTVTGSISIVSVTGFTNGKPIVKTLSPVTITAGAVDFYLFANDVAGMENTYYTANYTIKTRSGDVTYKETWVVPSSGSALTIQAIKQSATPNSISFNYKWKGTWSSATAYSPYDTVYYSGSSYVAVATSTNQTPGVGTTYWNLMAQGGGAGAVDWGDITGTLADQADLVVALGLRLLATNNLSDIGSASTARTNLGLGTAAVMAGPSGTIVGTSDTQILTNKTVDGATPAEIGYLSGVTSSLQTQLGTKLTAASNLSDIASASTARTNLGLGTAATSDTTAFDTSGSAAAAQAAAISASAQRASNLSDLASASTARSNLGLATIASSGSASDLGSGTVAAARGGAGAVSGALRGNGSGTVSQAACADLSNAGTGCTSFAAWEVGFNFRNTSGYVTDDACCQFVNEAVTYPTTSTINGLSVTYGWTTTTGLASSNRSLTIDRRLAGNIAVINNITPPVFRVDLPSSGTYVLRLGIGDTTSSRTSTVVIKDNTTNVLTVSALTTTGSVGSVGDAAGNLMQGTGSAVLWTSSNVGLAKVFSTSTLFLHLGANDGNVTYTALQHLMISRRQ